MLANKFDERRWIRLPVFWEPFEILEHSVYSRCGEQRDGVLGVLVKIGVEDSLIHKVLVLADVEEHPPQIVELERCEQVGRALQRLLDCLSVFTDNLLCSGLGLRNDRKAITRGTFRIKWTISPLFELKISFLRNGHRSRLRPVVFGRGRPGLRLCRFALLPCLRRHFSLPRCALRAIVISAPCSNFLAFLEPSKKQCVTTTRAVNAASRGPDRLTWPHDRREPTVSSVSKRTATLPDFHCRLLGYSVGWRTLVRAQSNDTFSASDQTRAGPK